jgi:hypothetical protein
VRDDSGVHIDFRALNAAAPPASVLLAAMVDEMVALYAADGLEPSPATPRTSPRPAGRSSWASPATSPCAAAA